MSAFHTIRHRWPLVMLAATAILLVTAVVPASEVRARPLAAPSLSVDPASGVAGRTVRVFGTGWIPAPNGAPYQVHWDSMGGQTLGTFAPNGNGAFSVDVTIPSSAREGNHTIHACQNCSGKGTWATAVFDVESPAPPTRPPPTLTPTPTRVPTECDRSGIAGEYVIDFEDQGTGSRLNDTTLPPGVRFLGDDSLIVLRPAVRTRSGSKALVNDFGGREFGSSNVPIRIGFDSLADFVGVFVGLNEQVWATEAFTATLTAYGLDEAGRRVVVASDSDTLGPEAEPIEVCLAVSAPGQIFEVTISYGGVAEPEVIDDLVIRGPEAPVPVPEDDLPPVVTIENPADHSIITETSVRLDGMIVEDRELARAEVWLNGSLYRDIGFSPAGESNYLYFLDGIPASDLENCGENVLEVRGWDSASNQGAASVNFVFRAGDLELVGAEPVQVLYDAPLIREKATAFRVKVNSTFACEVDADFRLMLPEDQWDTGAPTSLTTGGPSVVDWRMPDVSGPVSIPGNASDFEIMLPYIADGMADTAWDPASNPFGKFGLVRAAPRPFASPVTFSVEVDPEDKLGEEDEGNNAYNSEPYRTLVTRGIQVVFVGQVWDHQRFVDRLAQQVTDGLFDRVRFTDESQFIDHLPDYAVEQMDYLLGTYPVADRKISWVVLDTMYFRADYLGSYEADYDCWDADTGTEKGCNQCFSNMMSSMVQGDDSTSGAHAVGLVQPYGCCGCNGSGIAVYVEDDGFIDGNLVHELGHQDIGASDCYACRYADGTCGCNRCGGLSCESCVASEGFWVNHWQPYDESAAYYMSCVADPSTIWARLERCATTAGAEASFAYLDLIDEMRDEADPPAVVVRGMLSKQDEATFAPFLRVDQAVIDLQPDSTGTHAIVFVDEAGQVLASHGFTPVFTRYLPEPEGAVETDSYHFSFRVAWMDGIAAIELRDAAGKVLASRPVSASAPTVQLLEPNGGEQWRQQTRQAIRWEGTDPDGDMLSYALWISDDGGESWQPLAIDIADTRYTIDTTGFPAGNAFRLKVRVTDGVNTGVDTSDASFAVAEAQAAPSPILILAGVALAALIGVALVVIAMRPRKPRVRDR